MVNKVDALCIAGWKKDDDEDNDQDDDDDLES